MKRTREENSLTAKRLARIENLPILPSQQKAMREILTRKVDYVHNEAFRKPSIMEPIMRQEIEIIPNTPLGADQEVALFLQMNYARWKLNQCRRHLLRKSAWQMKDVRPLLHWYDRQLDYRSRIVTSNMGLVLSMIKRVSYQGVEFTDMLSEGSMALLRSVEKFDCSFGFKFSTYACRAILKGFSRAAKLSYRYRTLFPAQLDVRLEKDDKAQRQQQQEQDGAIDEVQTIMRKNLADLSDVEMSVVKLRFSLDEKQMDDMTLKEVGAKLGLTKERIRQIQNRALSKLRTIARERLAAV